MKRTIKDNFCLQEGLKMKKSFSIMKIIALSILLLTGSILAAGKPFGTYYKPDFTYYNYYSNNATEDLQHAMTDVSNKIDNFALFIQDAFNDLLFIIGIILIAVSLYLFPSALRHNSGNID